MFLWSMNQPCLALLSSIQVLHARILSRVRSHVPVSDLTCPWPSLLLILVASPCCPASEPLPQVTTVLSGPHGPQEPGPESSLVLALLQGWPQESSLQGEWADLIAVPGVGRETFSRPDLPRIALMRNSDSDPLFWSHLVGFNSGCNSLVTFKTIGFSYQSVCL